LDVASCATASASALKAGQTPAGRRARLSRIIFSGHQAIEAHTGGALVRRRPCRRAQLTQHRRSRSPFLGQRADRRHDRPDGGSAMVPGKVCVRGVFAAEGLNACVPRSSEFDPGRNWVASLLPAGLETS